MISRGFAYIACFSALSVPLALSAQETPPSPPDEIIMNAWADPIKCNLANAKHVSFSDLAADPKEWLGECVAVEGYWLGRALFGSTRHARMERSNITDRLLGKRIGLYADWDSVGGPPDRPARTIFAGQVGECETQWPGAMMVMGYCHYTGGTFLIVSEAATR